jgi:hypothetical protein
MEGKCLSLQVQPTLVSKENKNNLLFKLETSKVDMEQVFKTSFQAVTPLLLK